MLFNESFQGQRGMAKDVGYPAVIFSPQDARLLKEAAVMDLFTLLPHRDNGSLRFQKMTKDSIDEPIYK